MSNILDDYMTDHSENSQLKSNHQKESTVQEEIHHNTEMSISKNFSILDNLNHDIKDKSLELDETVVNSNFDDIQKILSRNDLQLRKHYVNDKKRWRFEPIFILFFIIMMIITTMLLYYTNTYI